jgi:acylpyruvate hydrolase
MKLVTFEGGGTVRIGALIEKVVVDLTEFGPTMVDFLAGGAESLKMARNRVSAASHGESPGGGASTLRVWKIADIRLRAPLLRPAKILCIGLNYADHAAEQGTKPPENPVVFSKFANCIIGPEEPIVLPKASQQVDYEAELAFVIGQRARHVPEKDALNYVAGYTICHDVSARDIQFKDGQWVRGKSCDTFCPLGPAIVTADEVPDPHALDIELRAKGQTLQKSNTKNLIFGIPHLVHFLTQTMTLEPGDIVSTGTPPGVGVFRKPPVFLAPGDTVEITIEKLGTLKNPCVAEA